jgi:threonine-phosphate decarboxylase
MKNVNAKESSHGGNVWAASHKWGFNLDEILDFSANINPLGPSEESLSAIHNPARLMVHYPEPTGQALKDALGTYLGLDKTHLVLGNGGSELIYLLGRMYGQKRVIIVAPTFSGYGEGIEEPNLFRIPLYHKDQFAFPF